MSLVDRAKAITLKPQLEWPAIAVEPSSTGSLFTGYVMPLAAIGPIASAIGMAIIGIGVPFLGTYREPIVSALIRAVFTYIMVLVGVAILSAIANALAPNFGGRKDPVSALKLVAYSYTPALVAGIVGLIPALGIIGVIAGLYSLYLFYLGAPVLGLCTKDKAVPFTAISIVCAVVLGIIVSFIISATGMMRYGYGYGYGGHAATDVQTRAAVASVLGSALGGGSGNAQNAQALVNAVATAGADASQAQASGDGAAQTAAGLKMISAVVGGGKPKVTPIAHDALQTLLPAAVGSLVRSTSESTSSTFGGIASASATASYGSADSGTLEVGVADLGNMSGLAAIANIGAGLNTESSGDAGYEKNVDVNGHQVHEKWTNDGKHSDLMEIVDNRYAVSVTGSGVDIETALSAIQSIDIAKFQALGAAAH